MRNRKRRKSSSIDDLINNNDKHVAYNQYDEMTKQKLLNKNKQQITLPLPLLTHSNQKEITINKLPIENNKININYIENPILHSENKRKRNRFHLSTCCQYHSLTHKFCCCYHYTIQRQQQNIRKHIRRKEQRTIHLPKILVKKTITTNSSYYSYLISTWLFLLLNLFIFTNNNNNQNFYSTKTFFVQPVICERSFIPTNNIYNNNQLLSSNNNPLIGNINSRSFLPEIIIQQGGIIKDKNVTLSKQYNPIVITKDIIVKKGSKLTIESGTEILFDKKKGIIVHGILEVLGTINDKVKLNLLKSTQSATVTYRSQNNNPIEKQLIRLIDGDLPSEGRVQIKFNDKWHSLCTNSKNLTSLDINVICHQVGYQSGHWYKWFPKRNESLYQIMSKSFHCSGSETSITQCKRWNRVRAGGGVCDYHSDIGIRCSKKLIFDSNETTPIATTSNYDYWRGIEFIQSETTQEYVLDGQMREKISKSNLENVIINEAGMNEVGNATAAIRVFGQPPKMNFIDVKNSIYGIMIEDVDDPIELSNIKLSNNMGNPLFVNTSYGRVSLNNMFVENNNGDGIRIVRHERVYMGSYDFCKFANLGSSQSFPVILSHEQTFFSVGRDCCQEFISNNYQLTVHFPVLRSTPNNLLPESDTTTANNNNNNNNSNNSNNKRLTIPSGVNLGKDANLIIYDDYRDEYPFKLKITNSTRSQSIVSKSGRLKICYEPASYRTVLFTIEVVANRDNNWSGIVNDVEIKNSFINNNQGRGIWLDNSRSGIYIENTTVLNHNYLSGIHIENGTGQVIIQGGRITNNIGHGLLINLAGGYYHIDNSTISDNTQKGIMIEYDKRPELVPFNHTMHLGYSLISGNGENGLFIGNVCRSDAFWNISMNSFIKNGEDAISFQSCFPSSRETILKFRNETSRFNLSDSEMIYHSNYQELFISHNMFVENIRRAINIAPIFFLKSFIRHNLFRDHQLAVIHISNQLINSDYYHHLNNNLNLQQQQFKNNNNFNLDELSLAPANIRISMNRFLSNSGRYVANIGVQEDNPKHSLIFTKNILLDNFISEPYADLKPRSRVSAVVVVTSSNTKVIRNRFDNPQSTYELGSHLELHSKVINATTNYWGKNLDAASIYRRIFDRKNRYNLALVEFLQYLLTPEDLEYATEISFDRERDKITTFKNGTKLGGEIKGFEELNPDTYLVQDDIFIRPGGHLILRPGTVLKFNDGVGMMVQGRLDAIGNTVSPILFTSSILTNRQPQRFPQLVQTTTTTTQSPIANPWISYQPIETINNDNNNFDDSIVGNKSSSLSIKERQKRQTNNIFSQNLNNNIINNQNVRLSHTTMGRLEVQIDGIWGPVCDYNFDINDAAVVCQQLGMILNKDDWLLEKFQFAANDQQQISMMSTNVLMTNLRCDPSLDVDITKCKAEISSRGEFDGMCNSEVGIRCFPPSWSGIRLGMGAETSTLENVIIQRAGMFDYAAFSLKPALQIDLNKHLLSSITIRSNSDSGLGIMWNDVIGRHFNELSIIDSKFLNNERHGLELRTRGLTIKNCLISNNRQNGLDYNPTFSYNELNDLISWLYTPKNQDKIVPITFPLSPSPLSSLEFDKSTSSQDDDNSNKSNNIKMINNKIKHFSVPSSEDSYKFFIIQKNSNSLNNQSPDLIETFTIGTDPGHMLSIHLLNPIHPDSSESLNMTIGLNPESPIWDLRYNMTSFPMVSQAYKFYFNYSSGSKPKGNIVLYIRSRYNNRDLKLLTKYIPAHLVNHKLDLTTSNINSKLINSLIITNSNITKNGIGLKFRHPNNHYFYNDAQTSLIYHLRYSNETTNITNNLFEGNHFSSIFVGSDDYEIFDINEVNNNNNNYRQYNKNSNSSLIPGSEIFYYLLGNKIRRNKDGIRQFSRDIRQSYNVFHWTINDTLFESNKGGGINLDLPYFWRYDYNLSHTVDLNNNQFLKNNQFEIILNGHFAVFNMTGNLLKDNRCSSSSSGNNNKNVMIDIGGMEKKMVIKYNIIEYNACNRILQFNIKSHADKLASITAYFQFNSIRFNRKTNSSITNLLLNNFKYPKLLTKLHPQASDFAMSLRGIQPVNITRNLFNNPELRFELVVSIVLDPNEKTINAIENYWGSVLLSEIYDRIFDFDDWNNCAIVELSPYLTQDSFTSAIMLSDQFKGNNNLIDLNKPLGGRLTKSLTIPYRKEPYLVESDLTVMPNVKLTIEMGVIMEFMPNVGLLVLGEIIAAGSREKPIYMRPALSSLDIMPIYSYLFQTKTNLNSYFNSNFNLNYIADNQQQQLVSYDQQYIFKHLQMAYPIDLGSIRLCKNEICHDGQHIYENNVEDQTLRQEVLNSYNGNNWKMDGFLEIYNMTTQQWLPICDPLFNENTARVVCKQLGYSHLTIFKRGRRYTMEQEQITSIRNWPKSIQCEGDEASLSNCPLAPNGFTNQTAACHRESNQFVYVYCQDFPESLASQQQQQPLTISNEHLHHWGGIRLSCPSLLSLNNNDNRDQYNMIGNQNQASSSSSRSRLQYIVIDKAGMLHRKKSPAVQNFQCNAQMEYTVITNSAHHGLEIITSQGNQNYHQLRLRNNLGIGFNYLPFTGSSSASRLIPYLPLKHLDLSSDIFGLIDICGANKEIIIEDRILLFYRYGSQSVDCIKIITSKLHIKHIGIRMLQFDLFNSTLFNVRPDSLKIYDGNIFDRDSKLIVDLGVTDKHRIEKPELKFYQTNDNSMTVRMHVSGAGQKYGFVAEVVTTPISYNIQRDTYNNITFSEITNNKLGGLVISSAGESSPNLIIRNNRFENNCLYLFGNFTSCLSPIYMELQNCPKLNINNNLIKSNQGGITIKSYSNSAVSALMAYIENNVFEGNLNTNTLALLGPKTDPYQTVKVLRNFFTRNISPYLSNIVLSRIVANFSHNIISGNFGKHQIEVIGFDKLPLSHQTFFSNWIYNNTALLERDRSTVSGFSAGQLFYMNYFVNPDNYYELSTMNWSRYDVKPFYTPKDDEIIHLISGDGSTKDLFRKTVDSIPINIVDIKKNDLYLTGINAKLNWWGFDTIAAIHGRIRDQYQHEELLKVDFVPYLETNRTVLSGICAGGWQKVGNSCLVYIGSRMTYQEARDFCDRERATLPLLNGLHYEFSNFLKNQDYDFDPKIDRIWVRSFEYPRDSCPALNNFRTKNYDCYDKYSFICEKDPLIVVNLFSWHKETGGLIALILSLITIILALCCSICWSYKSRQRHKDRIERKNSIYASMRSNRTTPFASNNSLSELFLHRQIYNPIEKSSSSITDASLSLSMQSQPTSYSQTSTNQSNLVHLDPAYNTNNTTIKKKKSRNKNKIINSNRQQNELIDKKKISRSKSKNSINSPLSSYKQTTPIVESEISQPPINVDYVSSSPSQISYQQLKQQEFEYDKKDRQKLYEIQKKQEQQQLLLEERRRIEKEQQQQKQDQERERLLFEERERLRLYEEQERERIYQEQQQQQQQLIYRLQEQQRQIQLQQQRQQQYLMDQNQGRYLNQIPQYGGSGNIIRTPSGVIDTSSFTPAPSYRELHQYSNGSHTSSFSGSQINDEVLLEPMPIVAPVYSQINHALFAKASSDNENKIYQYQPPPYLKRTFSPGKTQEQQQKHVVYYTNNTNNYANNAQLMRDIDESESSNPTYYSNKIEVYEDSSNQSYLDQDAYNKALQKINNDNVSYVLTERITKTDEITKTSTIDSRSDLISMNPQGLQVYDDDQENYDDNNFSIMDNKTILKYKNNNLSNKALSETTSGRYCVETSFDNNETTTTTKPETIQTITDTNPIAATSTSIYGSSQRLSPISHSSFVGLDSKQGSRVYLETSFE